MENNAKNFNCYVLSLVLLLRGGEDFYFNQEFQKSSNVKESTLYTESTKDCNKFWADVTNKFVFHKATPSDEKTWAIFERVFLQHIAPIYGSLHTEKSLLKICKGEDRKGYLMFDDKTPVGILVFKTELCHELSDLGYDNSLEIKTLFVIDPKKNSGKGYGSKLLKKAFTVAKQLQAKAIHVAVSRQTPDSLKFFQKKKFIIIKTDEKHHMTGDVEYTLAQKLVHDD